jgi:hypothetical protein
MNDVQQPATLPWMRVQVTCRATDEPHFQAVGFRATHQAPFSLSRLHLCSPSNRTWRTLITLGRNGITFDGFAEASNGDKRILFTADGSAFRHLSRLRYAATDPFSNPRVDDPRAWNLSRRFRQVRSNALSTLLSPALGPTDPQT